MKVKPISEDEIVSNISDKLTQSTDKKRRPYEGLIPLNLFIVGTISILILSGCLFVWVASFSVTSNSIQNLNAKFIDESGQKIKKSLKGYIDPIAKVTKMMARDWNTQAVNLTQFREYLFPKFLEFGANGCGFFFNDTYSYRYTYTVSGTASNPITTYAQQPYGYVGTIRDLVNNSTGEVIKYNYQVDTKPIIMTQQDFWIYLQGLYSQQGMEGVVGEPYRSIGSTMAIYYAQWIYDQQLYKATRTKRIIGLAKVNLALDAIVNFLSQIELLGKGYVLVTLNSGIVIGGSINTTVNDGLSSVHVFDLETRGAGKLIRQFHVANGNTFKTFSSTNMKLNSDGAAYIVTPMKFTYENLEWNIFFVLYDADVNEPLILSSSISIGVTIVIVIVGIGSSLITGLIVSKPMKFLEKQFESIRVMDLESVVLSNKSVFKEVDSIFGNLFDTVMWLKEIKAFIPEYVFEQIKQNETISIKSEQEEAQKKKPEKEKVQTKDNISHSSSSLANKSHAEDSDHQSSTKSSFKTAQSLFKMGYSKRNCVVVHVKLEGLIGGGHEFISTFFKDFISAIGPVVKVNQATLQVMTCEEFQLSIASNKIEAKVLEKAIDCALKIIKASGKHVCPRIGICYGACHIGNIGTNTSRYYSVVGHVPDRAKFYSDLSCKYKVKIITDTTNLPLDLYIYRPLDRVEVKQNETLTIFEIIDKKNTDNDEWLYELENSKKNNKYQDFNQIFELFQPSYWENNKEEPSTLIDKCRGILERFKTEEFKETNDLACDELLDLFNTLPKTAQTEELANRFHKYSKKLYVELK